VASTLAPDAALRRFNQELPKDLAVRQVEVVDSRFHARHSCIARSYLYKLRLRKSAFGKRYSWWLQEEVDVEEMRQAAVHFVGMHDFRAFAERQELKKSTKVLVHQVVIFQDEGLLFVRVVGSHFLWHMVRRIIGILVAVGRGLLTQEDVALLLREPSDLAMAHTAPAAGLFFEKAFYGEEELRDFLLAPKPVTVVTGA
jgi:tRNA pseudouridine38-40 synthase